MNPNIVTIANAFYTASAVLGAPALIATSLYGFLRLRLWLAPAVSGTSFDSVKNPDGVLLILGAMARSIQAVAGVLGGMGQWLAGVIAIVAGALLLLALVLFLTGRGLHAQQEWARMVGGVLMVGVLLVGLLILLSTRGSLGLLALACVAASVYALLGLWRGFPA